VKKESAVPEEKQLEHILTSARVYHGKPIRNTWLFTMMRRNAKARS